MDIIKHFPQIKFVAKGYFAYSSAENVINYDPDLTEDDLGRLDLLHEIGHYLLGHIDYDYDIELLLMEVDAWQKAIELSKKLNVAIDNDYIDQCISSYDQWLEARSTCPNCENFSLQKAQDLYQCFACKTTWKVNQRKDRRPIRRLVKN